GNGRKALLHGHCHQKALVGTAPTVGALRWAGFAVEEVDSGCCGMAGSFGFEREHYDISVALGNRRLAPAVKAAPLETEIVAPGRLAPLLGFTIVGTIVGTKLLVMLSARAVTLILGAFVLGFVVLDLARFAPKISPGRERLLSAPVGLVAGVMGGITNAPGTALALYFVALGMDKREFVRSIAFTFLVV